MQTTPTEVSGGVLPRTKAALMRFTLASLLTAAFASLGLLTSWRCTAGMAYVATLGGAGVGGGFTVSGLIGRYFNNPSFAGSPSFTRVDQRLDFGTPCTLPPGGVGSTGEPGYRAVGAQDWSAVWTGQLIPAFSEQYTFDAFARGAITLKMKPAGTARWNVVIHRAANANPDQVGKMPLAAGWPYDVEVDYAHGSGPWGLNLRWSSADTPEEVIDSLNHVGFNANDKSAMFADIVKCARNSWVPAAGSTAPPRTDSNGWPLADAGYVFQESLNQGLDVDPLMLGTVAFRFNGSGVINVMGNCGDVKSAYDSTDNMTSGAFQVFNNHWNASYFKVTNSHRNDGSGEPGFTNLRIMRPLAPGSAQAYGWNSVFIQPIRDAVSHFSVLRFQFVANQQRDWSDRTLPSYFNQAGGSITPPHYGNGDPSDNGTAWEYEVMLCNETGRDLMISVPPVASDNYIRNLANLIRWGSDGVNPYTGPANSRTPNPQPESPVYAPLNPNLRVYLELGNELWNWAGPFYTDFSNISALAAADKAANDADYQAFNYDGVNDVNVWRLRRSIQRMMEISTIFRGVWRNAAMPDTSADPRVRPLYEWQYDNLNGTAQTALSFADDYYNNADGDHVSDPHPVAYYLWGGGGATYYGATNGDGLTTALPDSTFAEPALASTGYDQAPAGGSWTFAGTAGIARTGATQGDIPPAYSGDQVGYVTDKGSMTVAFSVPATQISNVYGVSFRAMNRTKQGASAPDSENLRVFLDGSIDITTRTFSQGNGYTPPGYNAGAPWTAANVPWATSQYYFTKSFTAGPGSRHTITITGMGDIKNPASTNQTAFIGEVRLTSVDAIYAGGVPAGGQANGQPTAQNYMSALNVEADWARAYGLQDLAYEGGWSLGGDDGGSWVQNMAKYGDARTETVQASALTMFLQAGGSLSVLGTYEQWPNWSDYFSVQGLLNVARYPIVRGVDAVASRLPAAPANALRLPNVLTPLTAAPLLDATPRGTIGKTGGWISWNVVSPCLATYSVTIAASGSYTVLVDDTITVASRGLVRLAPGLHTVRVQSTSGAVTLTSVTVSVPGSPVAPALTAADGDGAIMIRWNAVAGATGYTIAYGTASGRYSHIVDVGTRTSATVAGLVDGQGYYLVAWASNASGPGLPSHEALCIPLADGQSGRLVVFDFDGCPGNRVDASPAFATSRVAASKLVRGGGLKPTTYVLISANTLGSEASDNRYGQDLAGAIAKDQYYQFTVTPVASKKLNFGQLRFWPYFQNAGASGDPRGAGITYSTDGVQFNNVVAEGAAGYSGSPFTVDLSAIPPLQGVAAPVIIRIYLYGNGPYEFSGIGGPDGEGIDLTGSFTNR